VPQGCTSGAPDVLTRLAPHVRHDRQVAAPQNVNQIHQILERLNGQKIAGLQVLGINSLKSLSPMPHELVGDTVIATAVSDRMFTIRTNVHTMVVDLQRTGRLVWVDSAAPYTLVAGAVRPTVRLLLADGSGLDLTEPAKTKRIAVTLGFAGQ
jgi:hypothetical protein